MKSFFIFGAFLLLSVVQLEATAVSQFSCVKRNLTVTVDDTLRLYIDGVNIIGLPNANIFNRPDVVDLPCTATLIAIHGSNWKEVAGIIASTNDQYILTNSTWKCSNVSYSGWERIGFDDSAWVSGIQYGYNGNSILATVPGISSNAAWIWLRQDVSRLVAIDENVYCRKRLDPNFCDISSPCLFEATCIDEANGEYKCICAPGYTGKNCSTNVDECSFDQPINECDPSMGSCTSIPSRGYSCSCYLGYTNDGQHKCKDVDECQLVPTENDCNAGSGSCINTPGSYKCRCYEGFTNAGDQRCEDIDECMNGVHNCSNECLNTNGSYECGCPEGFRLELDNQTCEAEHSMTEVTGKVPLIAATGALVLLPIAVIVSIILVRRQRITIKQNSTVEEVGTPKDEVPTADNNAAYESLELPDVNGGKNHIYEPVRKTPRADNATYEGLQIFDVCGINSDTYESLRKQ